eukprot:832376-Pleurochrysis_carterae.AAC.1
MTVEEHPSPGGSRLVKTFTVRPKVFYGEPDPYEASPRRPPSFTDPMPREFLDPAFREQFFSGSSSATLALEPPPWLHSLRPYSEDQNSSTPVLAWPPSLPPSPPASEQSETGCRLPRSGVASTRVTRSQTRAREAAGLPSLLVTPSTPTPVVSLSDPPPPSRSRKQPRLMSA